HRVAVPAVRGVPAGRRAGRAGRGPRRLAARGRALGGLEHRLTGHPGGGRVNWLPLPKALTSIAGLMIPYGDVIADEVRRMRIARISRGHDPRWIWQARATRAWAGALLTRSYERGERVYLAMVSRGYAGSMPVLQDLDATRGQWLAALSLPAAAALVATTAWGVRPGRRGPPWESTG